MIYRATVSESFWQLEMIQTALNIKDKQIENLRKYIVESEFLDYTTANNLNKKLGALVKRFAVLDSVLIEELAQADTKTAEFITFYSIVKNERIVYDFLNEIIFSNFMKLKKYIGQNDVTYYSKNDCRMLIIYYENL